MDTIFALIITLGILLIIALNIWWIVGLIKTFKKIEVEGSPNISIKQDTKKSRMLNIVGIIFASFGFVLTSKWLFQTYVIWTLLFVAAIFLFYTANKYAKGIESSLRTKRQEIVAKLTYIIFFILVIIVGNWARDNNINFFKFPNFTLLFFGMTAFFLIASEIYWWRPQSKNESLLSGENTDETWYKKFFKSPLIQFIPLFILLISNLVVFVLPLTDLQRGWTFFALGLMTIVSSVIFVVFLILFVIIRSFVNKNSYLIAINLLLLIVQIIAFLILVRKL